MRRGGEEGKRGEEGKKGVREKKIMSEGGEVRNNE